MPPLNSKKLRFEFLKYLTLSRNVKRLRLGFIRSMLLSRSGKKLRLKFLRWMMLPLNSKKLCLLLLECHWQSAIVPLMLVVCTSGEAVCSAKENKACHYEDGAKGTK